MLTWLSVLLPCSPGQATIPDESVRNAKNGAMTFVLTGRVVAVDGKPILSARVQMGTAIASTDAQGSFLLPVVSGESKISISASGYVLFTVPVSISTDTDLNSNCKRAKPILCRNQLYLPSETGGLLKIALSSVRPSGTLPTQ